MSSVVPSFRVHSCFIIPFLNLILVLEKRLYEVCSPHQSISLGDQWKETNSVASASFPTSIACLCLFRFLCPFSALHLLCIFRSPCCLLCLLRFASCLCGFFSFSSCFQIPCFTFASCFCCLSCASCFFCFHSSLFLGFSCISWFLGFQSSIFLDFSCTARFFEFSCTSWFLGFSCTPWFLGFSCLSLRSNSSSSFSKYSCFKTNYCRSSPVSSMLFPITINSSNLILVVFTEGALKLVIPPVDISPLHKKNPAPKVRLLG